MKILDKKITWRRLFKDRSYKINKNSNKKVEISEKLKFNIAINDDDIIDVIKRNKNKYKLVWRERIESISRSKSAFISKLIRIF